MKYKENPRNGDKISILGFGCMRFAGDGKVFGKFNQKKAEEMIKAAYDKGINYFDTAYFYGTEEILGKTLAKYDARKNVFIATKILPMICKSIADLDKYFSRQLEKLQTDYIDYYLLHMLSDIETWNKLHEIGIEDWIQKKKEEGKIRQIGFSFHGSQNAFLSLLDVYNWDIVQIQYNYSDENFQAGVTGLKKAAERNIPVTIMEPLLGGKLTSSLPQKAIDCFKNANPDLTPAGWALRWLWNQPEIICVLSGMNRMNQIEENVQTAQNSEPNMLTEKELEVYKEAKKIFNESFKVHCTGCRYCMPCPFGVHIPDCFSAYNTASSINKSQGKLQYSMGTLFTVNPGYAGLCKKCGKCEPLCPQHIPIIKTLEEVKKNMEGVGFKVMSFVVRLFMGNKKGNSKL